MTSETARGRAEARDRIVAATGLHLGRHLSSHGQDAVDWLACQDPAIVDGIVELLGMARALTAEAMPPPAPRQPARRRRSSLGDTWGNSGP